MKIVANLFIALSISFVFVACQDEKKSPNRPAPPVEDEIKSNDAQDGGDKSAPVQIKSGNPNTETSVESQPGEGGDGNPDGLDGEDPTDTGDNPDGDNPDGDNPAEETGETNNVLDIPSDIKIAEVKVMYKFGNALMGGDFQAQAGTLSAAAGLEPLDALNLQVDNSAVFLNYGNENIWKVKINAVTRNTEPLSGPGAKDGISLYGVQLDANSGFAALPKVIGVESDHIFLTDDTKLVVVQLDGQNGNIRYADLPENSKPVFGGSLSTGEGYFVVLENSIVSFKRVVNGKMDALITLADFTATAGATASYFEVSVNGEELQVATPSYSILNEALTESN